MKAKTLSEIMQDLVEAKPPQPPALVFSVPAEEFEAYKKWFKKHHTKGGSCKTAVKKNGGDEFSVHGAIDGHLTWEFNGTSLGDIICVSCSCGERVNLTDKAGWVNFG